MSIVSSCVSLRIYTTHTILKFFICVLSPTSTRSLLTSLHLVVSMSCWISKTFEAPPTRRPSALAPFGSGGEKWVFSNLDVSSSSCLVSFLRHECIAKEGKEPRRDCRPPGSPCRLRWPSRKLHLLSRRSYIPIPIHVCTT